MNKKYVALTKFISNAFIDERLEELEIEDDWIQRVTLYRNAEINREYFLLLRVTSDFRAPDWSIELRVGEGFPELAEDTIEFYQSTISLSELGVLNEKVVGYLPLEIDMVDLCEILDSGIAYCIEFIRGDMQEAITRRNDRNRSHLEDPLGLESNEHKELYRDDPKGLERLKSTLAGRNEELRELLKKYLYTSTR